MHGCWNYLKQSACSKISSASRKCQSTIGYSCAALNLGWLIIFALLIMLMRKTLFTRHVQIYNKKAAYSSLLPTILAPECINRDSVGSYVANHWCISIFGSTEVWPTISLSRLWCLLRCMQTRVHTLRMYRGMYPNMHIVRTRTGPLVPRTCTMYEYKYVKYFCKYVRGTMYCNGTRYYARDKETHGCGWYYHQYLVRGTSYTYSTYYVHILCTSTTCIAVLSTSAYVLYCVHVASHTHAHVHRNMYIGTSYLVQARGTVHTSTYIYIQVRGTRTRTKYYVHMCMYHLVMRYVFVESFLVQSTCTCT